MSTYKNTIQRIIKFRDDRDWKKFHSSENLAKSIVIESAELLENFQWGDQYSKDELKDEIADILIYSILLCDSIDTDVLDVINHKLDKNEKRFPIDRVKGNSGRYTKVKLDD